MSVFGGMSGVYMANSTRGIALSGPGGSGAFYTKNGGIEWRPSNLTGVSTSTDYTNATAVMSNQYAIISVNGTGTYYSTDYGVTWTASEWFNSSSTLISSRTGTFYSLCMNGQHACIQDGSNVSYYSSNAGVTWTASTDSIGSPFVAMSMNSSGQVIATSQNTGDPSINKVCYSTNWGQNWTPSTYLGDPVSGWLVNIDVSGNAIMADAGDNSYYSTDGGITFLASTGMPNGQRQGSMFLEPNGSGKAIACNINDKLMYYSTNFGATWTASGGYTTTSELYNALFISDNYAIAGNLLTGGPSLYSTDAGATWTESTTSINNVPQYVRYLTGLTGIMSSNTALYYTTDGGNNWRPAYPPYCFREGSKILRANSETGDEEYIVVQDLRKGDLIKTVSSGLKKIEHIGYSKIYNNVNSIRSKDKLYRCSTSEYPELTEDLIITGCHSILIKNFKDQEQIEKTQEVLGKIYITEKHYRLPACVDERTKIFEEEGVHTIWHFSLEHSDYYMNYGVYANGLLVETTSHRMMLELSGHTLIE